MTTWCTHLSKHVTGLLEEILPLALLELQSSGVEVPTDATAVRLSGALTPRSGRERAWLTSIYWRTSRTFVMKLRKSSEQRGSHVSIVEEMHYRGAAEPVRLAGDEAAIIGDWIAGLAGAAGPSCAADGFDAAGLVEAAAFAFDPRWEWLHYDQGRGELGPLLSIWKGGKLRRFGSRFEAPGDGAFSHELQVALDAAADGRVHATRYAGQNGGVDVFIGPPPPVRRVNDRNPIEILRLLSKLPPGACLIG